MTEESEVVFRADIYGLYKGDIGGEELLAAEEERILSKRILMGRIARLLSNHLEPDEVLNNLVDIENNKPKRIERVWVAIAELVPKSGQELVELIEDSQLAREELARRNRKLVISIANRYHSDVMPLVDRIGEGNVGLMIAVDKYDGDSRNRFSTYATYWIKQQISRALSQKTETVRIPLYTKGLMKLVIEAEAEIRRQGGVVTDEEIAIIADLDIDKVKRLKSLIDRQIISLDEMDGENGSYHEYLPDMNESESDRNMGLADELEGVLATLDEELAGAVKLRFGFGAGGYEMTLQEIADIYGVTREAIRVRINKVLLIIKSARPDLKAYLDMWEEDLE